MKKTARSILALQSTGRNLFGSHLLQRTMLSFYTINSICMYFRDICCSQNQELHPLGSVLDTVTSHGDCIRINLICEEGPKVGAKVEYDCFKEGFDGIIDMKDDIKNYMEMMMMQLQSNTCSMNTTRPEIENKPNEGLDIFTTSFTF